MKKIVFFAMGLVSMTTLAQTDPELDGRVGINTTQPKASLEIARHTEIPAENPQGLLLPHLTTEQRNAFTKSNNQYFDTKIQENKAIKLYIIGGRANYHTIIENNTFARVVNASDCIMELYDYKNVCGNSWGGDLNLKPTSNRLLEGQAPYQATIPYPLYLISNN